MIVDIANSTVQHFPVMNAHEYWKSPLGLQWCQWLLNSYHQWLGEELIARQGDLETQSERLYHAPFVVISHGTQNDPLLNYGNQIALELWEMDWAQFSVTPSRLTAEPVSQVERAQMLQQAATRGHIRGYQGIRISQTGRRFWVDHAIVWNVLDEHNTPRGQAATFSAWQYVETPDKP